MSFTGLSILIALAIFACMMAAMELGRRLGLRFDARSDEEAKRGTGAVEGAMFALLGLLLAFAFGGAAARFEHRRDLIVQEANTIGTAYLRLDLLPGDRQPSLRQGFRDYVDARLLGYALTPAPEATAAFDKAIALQPRIWDEAVAAAQAANSPAVTSLTLPPINDMFDIATTRAGATIGHPPLIIHALLIASALVCSLLAGRNMASRNFRKWLYRVGFALMVAFTIFVIIDLEFPRIGFIQLDRYDFFLRQVRESME